MNPDNQHPLQNRVQPDGEIVSTEARGLLFGNRGGRIHDPETHTLFPARRWASRQWICCILAFKERQRTIMGPGTYTELFFLDEVTALSAGHRPCFECRRADATAFAECWRVARGLAGRPRAKEMDQILHAERLQGRSKRTHELAWNELPDGSIVRHKNRFWAKHEGRALEWTLEGYRRPAPDQVINNTTLVTVLTPPTVLGILRAGYLPRWHPSAPAN